MHLFDGCPISDGASGLLLVAEEMAKSFNHELTCVAGIGLGRECHEVTNSSGEPTPEPVFTTL